MLEPEQYDVLQRSAALQGVSIGSLVRSLIDSVLPGLQRAVQLGEAYAAANDAIQSVMADAMVTADQELAPQLAELRRATEAVFERIAELGASSE